LVYRKISSNIIVRNISGNLARDIKVRQIYLISKEGGEQQVLNDALDIGNILPHNEFIVPLNMKHILKIITGLSLKSTNKSMSFEMKIRIEYFDLMKSQVEPYIHQFKSENILVFANRDIKRLVESNQDEAVYLTDFWVMNCIPNNGNDLSRFDLKF